MGAAGVETREDHAAGALRGVTAKGLVVPWVVTGVLEVGGTYGVKLTVGRGFLFRAATRAIGARVSSRASSLDQEISGSDIARKVAIGTIACRINKREADTPILMRRWVVVKT